MTNTVSSNGASLDAREHIRLQVIDALTSNFADGRADDPERIISDIRHAIAEFQANANLGHHLPLGNPGMLQRQLESSWIEAGPMTKYFNHDIDVDELIIYKDTINAITSDGRIIVDNEKVSEAELKAIVTRLLLDAGAEVNEGNPMVTTMIWNNTVRASVSVPPVADCLDAAFRIYRTQTGDLMQIHDWGSMSMPAVNFSKALMMGDFNTIVSGPPGAGKTTLVQALLFAKPPETICRLVQEARELTVDHLMGGRWTEASDRTLRLLVSQSLRWATTFLVISETRGAEAYELIKGANNGAGFLSTLHAKSASAALDSLVSAAMMAGENVSEQHVRSNFGRLIDVVYHCEAESLNQVTPEHGRRRQVMEIAVVPAQITGDQFVVEPIFKREHIGAPLEFMGIDSLGPLQDQIDRLLPHGKTIKGLCEGKDTLAE